MSCSDSSSPEEPIELFPGDEMNPAAHNLSETPYTFNHWDEDKPQLAFPKNMIFQQSNMADPELEDEMTDPYFIESEDYHADDQDKIGFPYKLTGRSRINGLAEDGVSFINTGRDNRDGYAAVVGLYTGRSGTVTVSFLAGTILPNSRIYSLRLQYRVGINGPFKGVLHNGFPVEYRRNDQEGHTQQFGPIELPAEVAGQEYVQLRWKYYFTGERALEDVGRRAMLRLDDIVIEGN